MSHCERSEAIQGQTHDACGNGPGLRRAGAHCRSKAQIEAAYRAEIDAADDPQAKLSEI
jgi:hypothetical protein